MKRSFVVPCVVFGVILLLGLVAWWQLPSVVTLLLERAINGRIEVRQSTVSWNGWVATMELNGVVLSGDIRGTVKKARLDVGVGRGILIKYGFICDFDVIVEKERGTRRFLPFQLEYAEISRGRAVYRGQTFTVNSISVRNFNTAGRFEFSLDASIEGLGGIKTHGAGVWRDGRSGLRGTYQK